jgi:hypothetical protein
MAGQPGDERERTRMRLAMNGLQSVLTDVATSVVSRIHERCPYRTANDHCTFAGGCVNQRRLPGATHRLLLCGGDHRLKRARSAP